MNKSDNQKNYQDDQKNYISNILYMISILIFLILWASLTFYFFYSAYVTFFVQFDPRSTFFSIILGFSMIGSLIWIIAKVLAKENN